MLKNTNKHFVLHTSINTNYKYYLKLFFSAFLDCFFKFILLTKFKKYKPKKYKISICAIFKNEAHNINEWIEFHKIVGIEHFYLYNNFSDDNFKEVLKPYINLGIVSLIDWPVEFGQFSSYKHFYDNYRDETNWVTFLDLDEFITPFHKKNIYHWLESYKYYPCVVIYWKMFGSSAKLDHNFKMLTTEQYTVCWDKMYNVGKVFVNTDFDIAVFDSGVHHLTKVKIKVLGNYIVLPPINEFKKFILWDIHRVGFFNKAFTIQINHYWSKSFGYYFDNKVKRGDVNKHERTIDTFFSHEYYNNHVDFKIFKFLIELKRSLGYTKLIENND